MSAPGCCLYADKGGGWFVLETYALARQWVRGDGLVEFETISFEGLIWRVTLSRTDICQVDEMTEERWRQDSLRYMQRKEQSETSARMAAAMESVAADQKRIVDEIEGEDG